MIKSFFTTAIRHLLKNKWYAALNIFGLSVGLACFTIIALWVMDELSYDQFHVKKDRIFRVAALYTDESGEFNQAVTPAPLGPALIADLPEVENAVRIDRSDAVVQLDDKQFREDDILAVDPSFFEIFTFDVLKGNANLTAPYTVVLSESMAKKYFGDANPVGQSIKMFLYDPGNRGADYKITGVIADCPGNAHFSYNFLISFKTFEAAYPEEMTFSGWFNNGYYTYVLTKPGVDTKALNTKFATVLEKYIGKEMKQYKIYWSYFLQPVSDIHLKSNLRYEMKPTSSFTYVAIFGTIGLIVLVLACINYVNLSTAYSSDRFKEVGVRKVMGAMKKQLIGQHLVESWLLAVISLFFAIVWIELSRPLFENLTGKELTGLYSFKNVIGLFTIATIAGLLSGIYPSLVLSSFKTVNILKGQFKKGASGILLRKFLVVLQYSISIILIVGILVVQLQMKFIRNKDLGFEKDNLIVLSVNGSDQVMRGYEGFAQALSNNPNVTKIARSNSMLAGGLGNGGASAEDATGKPMNATMYRLRVDHEYIDTYEMKILAGRNFIKGSAADSSAFVINEAAAKIFGYQDPADMVGKRFGFSGIEGQVIGVVKDFHYNSLQHKVEPAAMYLLRNNFSRITVKFQGNVQENLEAISSAWKQYFPESIFEYAFAEDRLQEQYEAEQRFSKIFFIFSAISLAIACLGLFSLVSYAVESRTKEIGIRKVLGASVPNIVAMLSKEFLLLILISCIIATPVAYYFMERWLQDFAYHISMDIQIFMIAGLTAFAIALLTISAKSVRSALHNPVDALRND